MSACYEACAENWPPVTVDGMENLQAGDGVDASMMSVSEREGGTLQVAYNGHPLYYFVQDQGADESQGQEIESQTITKEIIMARRPPEEPYDGSRYRRYWGYYNRPYGGCGCLYALLLFVLIWWIIALFIPELALWSVYF